MIFRKDLFVNLEDIIKNVDQYHAHKGKCFETLRQHIYLCEHYFIQVLKKKRLELILERLMSETAGPLSPEAEKCLGRMIMNVITFHDVGKVNPLFQRQKMKNIKVEHRAGFEAISSQHSMLSAVCYLDYFMKEIASIPLKAERKIIQWFAMLNAYIIANHHSSLKGFDQFVKSFYGENAESTYEVFVNEHDFFYKPEIKTSARNMYKLGNQVIKNIRNSSQERQLAFYTYEKILFSLLIMCDYYATSEFLSGVVITDLGNIENISEITDIYDQMKISKKIANYKKQYYLQNINSLENEKNVNVLRNEMYLDAESVMKKNIEESLFFLESPTGSGKSNVAFNLSFKLLNWNTELQKIIYTYPFNTLVDQNLKSLKDIFGNKEEVIKQIAVINSTTPIKLDRKIPENEELLDEEYVKALLDRQFLNYPIILTTHVSLFHMMFGINRNSGGSFYQLANSVLVLDEIQSYRNNIWTEIIIFLKTFARLLNIKVIIMSATLPNLDLLWEGNNAAVRLIEKREKYFSHSLFKNRVRVRYNLMGHKMQMCELISIIKEKSKLKKKILIEFIKKDSAFQFFRDLKEALETDISAELITGEDSIAERERILDRVRNCNDQGIILVATQVVEAGVDIDMDLGYKNYSKLDSEEQFMGRINRNCKGCGEVYFFDMDEPRNIYRGDVRMDAALTIKQNDMREILKQKNFEKYYKLVLDHIKKENDSLGDSGVESFFYNHIGVLDFPGVEEHMTLIEPDNWSMGVYLSRRILLEGHTLDGQVVWNEYVELLKDQKQEYAKKQVRLYEVRSKMAHFIYKIKKNTDLCYSDRVGDLYFIENGEVYFQDNKLIREKFENQVGLFLD